MLKNCYKILFHVHVDVFWDDYNHIIISKNNIFKKLPYIIFELMTANGYVRLVTVI